MAILIIASSPSRAGLAVRRQLANRAERAHLARMQQRATMIEDVEWRVSPGLIDYATALAKMEARAAAIAAGEARELVWLLEHPPVYTAGTSADPSELVDPRFPVVPAGRGGRYTYHGPGQRVGYLMLDLNRRGRDVRCFVHALEGWLIAALAELGIAAFRAPGRIGIWTRDRAGAEAKIGAIGIRVRRWVTLHGFSVNLAPDLSHFGGIVPCGLADYPVTSAAALGSPQEFATFDAALALTADAFLQSLTCVGENEA
ncbi:lipoyl(octanoyl) transferase LipB [Sphingomonas sp. BK580]|uniref:lipoyl(octanoyl) transferase LipB n=1 Tax=Sphingomonas sp. BK580 TaxID=2586972 RepID=UPI00182930C7|nr:lipoyl(octanoyl) transferase LipB [Sphingomonas sp. BK580]MBB3695483.1 lipoyl(octanoyl) transferase [Sphingomonas sp. BK580]